MPFHILGLAVCITNSHRNIAAVFLLSIYCSSSLAQSEVEVGNVVPITGLQNQVVNMGLNSLTRSERQKAQGVIGVLTGSLKSNASPTQIESAAANYSEDFDSVLNLGNGNLGSGEADLDALVGPLSIIPNDPSGSISPGGVLASAVGSVLQPLARRGVEDLIFGDLQENAKSLTAGPNPFVQSRQVSNLVQELMNASPAQRTTACRVLGQVTGTSPCPNNPQELINQVDQRGGNATLSQELLDVETRLRNNTLSPAEARVLLNKLNVDLKNEVRKTNTTIKNGITSLTELINNASSESEKRDGELIEGVNELDKKLDKVVTYIDEQRAAAKTEADRKRRQAELNEIYVTGHLIATVIGIADPELGKQSAAIVNTAITISKTFNNIENLGTAALTGNLVGAALGLVSAFSDTGPTTNELILEQLGQIQEDLSEIKQQIVKVDEKLDRIMSTLIEGIAQIQNGIDIIISDLALNTALTLDNQYLILDQSNIILNTLNDQSYRACVKFALNDQLLSVEEFRSCATDLEDYASNIVYGQEQGLPPNATAGTLKNIFYGPQVARSTSALREYFQDRENVSFTGKIASYEHWFVANEYLIKFLTYSPEQTIDVFLEGNEGFRSLKFNLQQLKDFKLAALSSIDDTDKNSGVFYELGVYNAAVSEEIEAAIDNEIVKENRLAANSDPEARGTFAYRSVIRPDIRKEWDELDAYDATNMICKNVPIDALRTTALAWGDFSERLPSADLKLGDQLGIRTNNKAVCSALLSGSVKLEASVRHDGSESDRTECVGSGFGQNFWATFHCDNNPRRVRHRIVKDNWVLNLVLKPTRTADEGIGLDRIEFSVTDGAKKWVETQTDPENFRSPVLCVTTNCLEKGYLAARDPLNFNTGAAAGFPLDSVLEASHNYTRSKLSEGIVSSLQNNTSVDALDEKTFAETVYLGALTRFALSQGLTASDGIYSIAAYEYHYPQLQYILSNMLNKIDVFRLSEYLDSRLAQYYQIFESESVEELIQDAKNTTEINVKLNDIDLLTDYFTNVRAGGIYSDFYGNDGTIPTNAGSTGGGGGSSLSLITFAIMLFMMISRLLFVKRGIAFSSTKRC